MFGKRQKRSLRARRQNQKGIAHVGVLFSGTLISVGLGIYLAQVNQQISPPAYEEVFVVASDLNQAVSKIDNAIYDSLYQGDVPDENINYAAPGSTDEGVYDLDFTELLINVSDRNSALRLKDIIAAHLKALKPRIAFETRELRGCEIAYHVSAMGLQTHTIRLIYGRHEKTHYDGLPKIALIIDDLGYDAEMAISFFELDLPLSFSVLPLAPFTETIAEEANRRGRELMLHLPMEPKNYPSLNPGPGALLTEMDDKEIERTLKTHLHRVKGSQGVNHHMGSYFTEQKDKMDVVLRELKKRNLFYIDSRTTSETVALRTAKRMGVPAARRHVFLDNEISAKSIRAQMERLLGMARHSGAAIGIGHPHKETLQVLKEYERRLNGKVKVVPASELVMSYSDNKFAKKE